MDKRFTETGGREAPFSFVKKAGIETPEEQSSEETELEQDVAYKELQQTYSEQECPHGTEKKVTFILLQSETEPSCFPQESKSDHRRKHRFNRRNKCVPYINVCGEVVGSLTQDNYDPPVGTEVSVFSMYD